MATTWSGSFTKALRLLGAPSAIGIRPYMEGGVQELWKAPAALRAAGVAPVLGAEDLGDVSPPAYGDHSWEPGTIRNEGAVAQYSRDLGSAIAAAAGPDDFVLLLAGECSVTLGALLGTREARGGRIGLVYVDAHADFATPAQSTTGSAAGMGLALSVGIGDGPLSLLQGKRPLVEAENVVLVGRRDEGEAAELRAAGIREVDDAALRAGISKRAIVEAIGADDLAGFWIHVDLDVLDPDAFPSVYVQTPLGIGFGDLAALLRPLVRHPRAVGMHVALYDPRFDPERRLATRLVAMLRAVFED